MTGPDPCNFSLPASAAPREDEARSEVLTSVKESLRKTMDRRGNQVLSEILVYRFASAGFHLKKGKLDGKNNLLNFLQLVSRLGKTKNGNKNRSEKKEDSDMVSGSKTDLNLDEVHIGRLQCSQTWEISNIKSSCMLARVELDVQTDEQHHQAEKVSLKDHQQAKSILQGMDSHLLVNVLQNAMLQLTLSPKEGQVVQALRICRNHLFHADVVPQLEKLQKSARVLQDALLELAQPSEQVEIKKEISSILKRLDANALVEELQAELVRNAPNQKLFERNFTLPSGAVGSLQDVCQLACQHKEVRVEGEVWSGRTSVLLAMYQMWARGVGPLASHYRLLLPLLQGPESYSRPLRYESASPEELVLHHLWQWTPGVLRDYGEAAVVAAVREVVDCSLALCDSALGYSSGPHWPHGPRVATDWPQGAQATSAGEAKVSTSHKRVVLLPLKSEQVETEVRGWQQQPSPQYELYKQLLDRELLSCPQALEVFHTITSKVVRNLDLEMMRALVEYSHSCTISSHPTSDKEFFFKTAFDNILSNTQTVTRLENRCVPAYLVGPRGGPYKFRSVFIEEYCAAMFVSRHASSASWKWLRQPSRFQRVFTFVLQIWNEEGTLQAHEATILNYLSVTLGLYRMKGKGKAHLNREWHVDRPADHTLEKEGFARERNPKCKLWLFVHPVLESVAGELWAVELVLRHLLQYNVWILDVERFNDSACDEFSRLCRKTVSILMRSKCDDGAHTHLPVMRVHDKCRDEILDRRAVLLHALSYFKELNLPMPVKVHQYYNCRDSKYGRAPLREVLSRGTLVLHDSPVDVTSYSGPLALVSLQDGALRLLQELRVTVYSLSAVHTLLHSCPSSLAVLCLNVDLVSSDSIPPPPVSRLTVSPSCYVRLAIRYSGSLKVLGHVSGLPKVSVLRLHGLYPPEVAEAAELPKFAVRCLVLKFVHGCGTRLRPVQVQDWCSCLLSRLTDACPGLQRLIVSRAPPSWRLSAIHDQVVQQAVQVRRLLVQGSDVSVQEAQRCLAGAQADAALAPDFTLLPRLREEKRRQLSANKPPGFELRIIGVPSAPSCALPWEPPLSPKGSISVEGTTRDMATLVQTTLHSRHTAFCYEAGKGTLQVLRAPTQDIRVHLQLPRLLDEEVQRLHALTAGHLHHLLAAAQYTRLQCSHLTAAGFLQLVKMMDGLKRRLTVGGNVAPYHVTVLSTQLHVSVCDLERQRALLGAELPRLTCLNYALFCVLDADGHTLLTVRKSHKGTVFSDLRMQAR